MSKRIVLFGGTFDPPHIGHLLMATLAAEQTEADVWFMPAPVPPHKQGQVMASLADRKDMIRQLISRSTGLSICDIEESLRAPSYTVDTLRVLRDKYPAYSFSFLMGADSLENIQTWKEWETVLAMTDFLVAAREGHDLTPVFSELRRASSHFQYSLLRMPLVDVSSTWIRQRVIEKLPLCGLVPFALEEKLREIYVK
ncbi:nicotinate (nicotinamide) nucleotide adenylyltransferase [Alicyclobacillus tolerans]|uniref:Probable nicotinate-nucleotide adenylyltransferase n=2 Tax=Alicyclobacillus tolerans TaxID=90970 RepID=A0A1M6JZH5_9BACL|nr:MULTISPECIES: nicotinate (nicotinamide) nucleotide adenylyltransferase [Alicyclobacillus]MDP9727352.1 nicotinate-nucleotide adenylyltransferase [Alicyclobacillus tengchongensis]QRF23094.1 nicotinate (nicotinamide) nucleotide adenylyltransferase [Alicyclobacillus sp. TC]SHJ52101.1 nicotinate-nucleotide adenylyltransferase [Alicyclobacillus montanus]